MYFVACSMRRLSASLDSSFPDFDVTRPSTTVAAAVDNGAELVGSEVVQYEDAYRLCYIRGPEGLLIGLAQELA